MKRPRLTNGYGMPSVSVLKRLIAMHVHYEYTMNRPEDVEIVRFDYFYDELVQMTSAMRVSDDIFDMSNFPGRETLRSSLANAEVFIDRLESLLQSTSVGADLAPAQQPEYVRINIFLQNLLDMISRRDVEEPRDPQAGTIPAAPRALRANVLGTRQKRVCALLERVFIQSNEIHDFSKVK